MTFLIEFTYETDEREKLLNFLKGGALASEGGLKLQGAWLAVETGRGYALIETKDGKAVYQLCSMWSEYGHISVTPVIDAKGL